MDSIIKVDDIVQLIKAHELKKASELIRQARSELLKADFHSRLYQISEINRNIGRLKFEIDKFNRIKEQLRNELDIDNKLFFDSNIEKELLCYFEEQMNIFRQEKAKLSKSR